MRLQRGYGKVYDAMSSVERPSVCCSSGWRLGEVQGRFDDGDRLGGDQFDAIDSLAIGLMMRTVRRWQSVR